MDETTLAAVAAGTSFAAALASLLTLALTRWSASQHTHSVEVVRRRMDLLERIAHVVVEGVDRMDSHDGSPVSAGSRDYQEIYNELDRCMSHARLYFDDAVVEALRPLSGWFFDLLAGHGPGQLPGYYDRVLKVLVEAAARKHDR